MRRSLKPLKAACYVLRSSNRYAREVEESDGLDAPIDDRAEINRGTTSPAHTQHDLPDVLRRFHQRVRLRRLRQVERRVNDLPQLPLLEQRPHLFAQCARSNTLFHTVK